VIIVHNLFVNLTALDWLNQNYWWPVILFVFSVAVIIKVLLNKAPKKSKVDTSKYLEEVVKNLGGIDNINQAALDGTRVKFQLKEIEVANLEAFKDMGATGVFISGKNVKMVLPFDAKDLVDKINLEIYGG